MKSIEWNCKISKYVHDYVHDYDDYDYVHDCVIV